MRSLEAILLTERLLEMDSVRKFLAKHDIRRTREFPIKPDPSYHGSWQIPLLDRPDEHWVNHFRPKTASPKTEFKKRLQHLVLHRKGYQPGDIFVSPWGRFLVTDVLGIKEI